MVAQQSDDFASEFAPVTRANLSEIIPAFNPFERGNDDFRSVILARPFRTPGICASALPLVSRPNGLLLL